MDGGEPGRQRDKPAPAVVESATQAEEDRLKRARLRLIGLGLQFGSTIVGSVVIFLLGGIWLDGRLGTRPLFLLVGMLLAFVAIGYNLYELATVKLPPGRVSAKVQPPSTAPRSAPASAWDDDEQDEDDWPVRRRAGDKGEEG